MLNCFLVKVATVICLSTTPGFKEVECNEYRETGLTMCVSEEQDKDCLNDMADEFVYGSVNVLEGRDEVALVRFLNSMCGGFNEE